MAELNFSCLTKKSQVHTRICTDTFITANGCDLVDESLRVINSGVVTDRKSNYFSIYTNISQKTR